MRLENIVILFLLAYCSYVPNIEAKRNSRPTRQQQSLVVQTSKGKVLGVYNQTEFGTKYAAFQGIPYAKPPIDKLRFELPQQFSWDGTWNATYERNECVQSITGFLLPVRGKEDCLYLNIYTRNLGAKNLKPVMVWIHGGSYLFGSGNRDVYSPDYFLERDLVVVTINYRLGIFGFLSTGDEVLPGNNGLKDQIFALKWLRENIACFGGDPDKITILGESSGASAVGHLIQSDLAEGSFQAAVLQSGTPILDLIPREKVKKGWVLLASAFGVANRSSSEIVTKLKTIDYVSLLLYSAVITNAVRESVFDLYLYGPVLEVKTASAAITIPPYQQLKNCQFNSVPILIGFNSEEALAYAKSLKDDSYAYVIFDQNPQNLVPSNLNVKDVCNARDIGNKIKEHYVGKNGSFVFSEDGIIRYVSDSYFMEVGVEYAKRTSNCNQATYMYRFSYNRDINATGAGHADELRYLFPTFPEVATREPLTETETMVSNTIVDLWSNFIKYRNPTPKSSKFSVTWNKSLSQNNYEYINIDKELSTGNLKNAPFRNDWEFWENLYNTCGRIDIL